MSRPSAASQIAEPAEARAFLDANPGIEFFELFFTGMSGVPRGKTPKIVSINAIPPQLVYVEKDIAPVLLAQPTYLWGEVGVDTIVDRLVRKKSVPERIPLDLVRVTRENLGSWVRQLRAWGFVDAPEEYLQRP